MPSANGLQFGLIRKSLHWRSNNQMKMEHSTSLTETCQNLIDLLRANHSMMSILEAKMHCQSIRLVPTASISPGLQQAYLFEPIKTNRFDFETEDTAEFIPRSMTA